MFNAQGFSTRGLSKYLGILALIGVLSFIGCGGGAAPVSQDNGGDSGGPKFNSPPPSSNVQIKIGDSPSERVVTLKLKLVAIQATPTSGDKVSLLSAATTVEVTHLAASNQLVAETTMPQGTYNKLLITTSSATVTYLDATTNAPVEKTFSGNLASTISFNPALKISSGGNILNLDVDVSKTVKLDLTKGTVTLNAPVFKVSVSGVASGAQQPQSGAVEHISGQVSSASGSAFTIKDGQSGLPLTFGTDGNTVFVGTSIKSMSGLIVDVAAKSLADGTLVATEVDNVNTSSGVSAEGLISGYTEWGYLNVIMQDGSGSGMTDAMLGSNLALGMDENTSFSFDSSAVDLAGLPFTFDVNSIVPGQRVEVDSIDAMQADPEGQNAGFVTAATIELQKQTLSGAVSNYVNNGDGTASFDLVLSSDGNSYLSASNPGVTSVEIHTSSKTALQGVSGDLSGKAVFVRGFLFYVDPSALSAVRSQNLKAYIGGGQSSSPYFAMAASQISQ